LRAFEAAARRLSFKAAAEAEKRQGYNWYARSESDRSDRGCIEKSKATADQELIAEFITEAFGILQTGRFRRAREKPNPSPLYDKSIPSRPIGSDTDLSCRREVGFDSTAPVRSSLGMWPLWAQSSRSPRG